MRWSDRVSKSKENGLEAKSVASNPRYIFQKGQVTSKLMVHKKLWHFLAQLFMAFHVVSSFLMRVLAPETIK